MVQLIVGAHPGMDSTCDYMDDCDENDVPCGNRCGRTATRKIRWADGRVSLGCDEHAREVSLSIPHLIYSVIPLPELPADVRESEA